LSVELNLLQLTIINVYFLNHSISEFECAAHHKKCRAVKSEKGKDVFMDRTIGILSVSKEWKGWRSGKGIRHYFPCGPGPQPGSSSHRSDIELSACAWWWETLFRYE
jgi:hypothetical protein